jgi:Protein of unknown function (DUF1553)/Protein of unknown function (DUF1549)/Concanavalin A-like lectin/glucanases superfamily/Planctomycete cytochrome C
MRNKSALAWVIALLVPMQVVEVSAAEKLAFNRDIRPIFAEYCLACHGPDSLARQADLRLDDKDSALAKNAVTPADVNRSSIIDRIFSDDPEAIMPPPSTKKVMKASEKEILKAWIAGGAEYEPHWSFIPPVRPTLPEVKDPAWVLNPIDRFVLAKLEQAGLRPAPEADRYTLIRRLSLDLRGLPPTVEEIQSFVDDKSVDAYEKLVSQYLQSERWGEHRAKYWLDAARYADTHGIHFDNFREMWTYRDWVIQAFNHNMPFDQFTVEQLAGDLLPAPTLEQKIATGFNRCNITTNEGGTIPEEYLVHYTRDRTETTAQVWMGLTANCCVCHDHKFDRLPQREFYEMAAFFNNSTQSAMDGNIKDTPPIIPVPSQQDRPRWNELERAIGVVQTKINERKTAARVAFEGWIKANQAKAAPTIMDQPTMFHLPLGESTDGAHYAYNGQSLKLAWTGKPTFIDGYVADKALKTSPETTLAFEHVGDFDAQQPFSVSAWIKIAGGNNSGAILARMDDSQDFRGWDLWLEGGKVGSHIIHKWPDNALKAVTQNPLPSDKWVHVNVTYDGTHKAEGLKIFVNGSEQAKTVSANTLTATIKTSVPLKIGQRNNSSQIRDLQIQDVRLYSVALDGASIGKLAKGTRTQYLLSKSTESRSTDEQNELYDWWLSAEDKEYVALKGQSQQLLSEKEAIQARGSIAHVSNERSEPPMAYVLFRGEYDKRREEVKPKTPSLLPAMPENLPRNRLGFAQWLLMPEQPLTSRVTVNRFWQEVFGIGIVKTAGDFGIVGELPSNQPLLDYLAVEFREGGWNVKELFRRMVTSATYRQSAATTKEKLELDPENRLLSRGPRFRMEAEMIRDYGLATSGLLTKRIGGPSAKPYQPAGVWEAVAMIGSNTRDYKPDSGENLYRRSLYTFWKRSAPPASMEIFNAPNRETCTVRRERTNTPLQALVTLNDPQFVEAAKVLAEDVWIKASGNQDVMLDEIALRILSRPLRAEEKTIIHESLQGLQAFYNTHDAEAKQLVDVGDRKPCGQVPVSDLASWTMLVNELMNLDEVVSK